ncbi:MAG: DUF6090 family protein [Melioribacteraceae bacterium]|nr:DUF6090 family protein [Melioribacteraceae bacterium]
MLKFFRRIREQLLSRHRFSQYFLYATGEIILVVLGILIALSINNWNQNRINRENEFYLLSEIANNLKEDKMQIEEIWERRKKTQYSIDRMIKYLPESKFTVDTFELDLGRVLTLERYFPIKNGYEVSKARGLQISNKELRTKIARYYEFEQNKVQASIEDIEEAFEGEFRYIFQRDVISDVVYGEMVKLKDPFDEELNKET